MAATHRPGVDGVTLLLDTLKTLTSIASVVAKSDYAFGWMYSVETVKVTVETAG